MRSSIRRRQGTGVVLVVLLAATGLLAACSSGGSGASSSGGTRASGATGGPTGGATAETVRLGYFGNVTHAPAIVGVEEGLFEAALGETELETQVFNAGPDVITALFSEALDASFIGPNPAVNGFAQSEGKALRIVSGSTSGGASLVVKPEITTVQDLRGKVIATPQLGNTQDVALRAFLAEEGFTTDTAGGGDVSIRPQANADTLTTFQSGDIDGAWLPEPWATRLIQEAGATVLVDEADRWPGGRFVTTHLIVRTEFLEQYPGTVKALIEGELAALALIEADPELAKATTNAGIERVTTKPLPQQVIDASWANLTFTADPIASSLVGSAEHAVEAGLLDPVDLEGIYDLTILNEVLEAAGEAPVEGR